MSSTPSGALARAKTPNGASKESPSKGDGHELQDLDSKPLLPIEEDIMQLARLGEIGAIQKLFDSGKFDASYADEQGITPLHVRIHSEWELNTGDWKALHETRAHADTPELSGQQSTTTTHSAISSSNAAQT
jgi:hypothetical protein